MMRRRPSPERLRYVRDKHGVLLCFRYLEMDRRWVRISLPIAKQILDAGEAVDETAKRKP